MEGPVDNEVFVLLMLVGVFAGFVDSAVGGGGLLRLPAILAAGLPPHMALGTNKFASTAAAAIASARYLSSEIVPRKAALVGFVTMGAFSVVGAKIVLSISADLLLGIVVVVLTALFFYVLLNPTFGKEEELREVQSDTPKGAPPHTYTPAFHFLPCPTSPRRKSGVRLTAPGTASRYLR